MYTYVFMFAIHRKLAQGQHFLKKGHIHVSGSLYKALQLCFVNCRFMMEENSFELLVISPSVGLYTAIVYDSSQLNQRL